ncbi:UTP--glucose-1-phosphate uridylyltransferase [Candidatus Finniella inopinata]|uniref:UTP--glucose-1-phosphate uridylyltransferase n=1 Tax=Candidatus Finniella inopinata TaxID=1696036 RepID=A0A4V2DZQ1_9PROT|nr:UTP--glucose-1-phosphate uridylyltransferase [Candidatus Finniella inopinata]RZI45837.1 UTP--glucose-1-phosphate uridylyltransferase [Candidatus Finniella inopinata]
MNPIKTCIFPVAGLGSRFLPATKSIPKEMMVVVDKPLIQYAVEEAKAAGIERFIFVTSQGKTAIEDHFDSCPMLEMALRARGKVQELSLIEDIKLNPGQAIYIRQQAPLGLGHAVLCAQELVNEDAFAVILADDLVLADHPCLQQMTQAYSPLEGNMVGVMEVPYDHTNRYGILKTSQDADGQKIIAEAVVEKPAIDQAPSRIAVIGRYILNSQIFQHLRTQKPGAGGEIQLTDAIQAMIPRGLCGFRFQGQRFDCGTKEGWLEANMAFAYADPQLKDHLKAMLDKYHF